MYNIGWEYSSVGGKRSKKKKHWLEHFCTLVSLRNNNDG